MVELETHNLCPLTNEVEECILGDRIFKSGIMRSRSYQSDGYGKAAHARKSHPYGATHHPHRVFGTVGNTSDTSPDTYAVQSSEASLSWGCHSIFGS